MTDTKSRRTTKIPVVIRKVDPRGRDQYLRAAQRGHTQSKKRAKDSYTMEDIFLGYETVAVPKSTLAMKNRTMDHWESIRKGNRDVYRYYGYSDRDKPVLYRSYITPKQLRASGMWENDPDIITVADVHMFENAYLGDLAMKNRRRSLRSKHPIVRAHADVRPHSGGARLLKRK